MTKIEDAIAYLESMKEVSHFEANLAWNSCPKAKSTAGRYDHIPENERECTCGVDKLNQRLDEAIAVAEEMWDSDKDFIPVA